MAESDYSIFELKAKALPKKLSEAYLKAVLFNAELRKRLYTPIEW
jgi:hypothetical protein